MNNNLSDLAYDINDVSVTEFLNNNYLPYTYYVILSRALTRADGLKPVGRRILYYMYREGITSKNRFTKASKIASNISGELHPHGNASVEGSLATLGQKFNMRVPLIDVYGNVGKFSGDTPAAARYWEGRLTRQAELLVEEVKDNAVKMVPTFDEESIEPLVLPAKWPNAIINGNEGIAVGYASKMPTHNPDEVLDAVIARVKNPDMDINELKKYIKGPDFPTGGTIIGLDGINEYLETGKGTIIIRGNYEIRDGKRGKKEISFYELPYQVSAETVTDKINKDKAKGFFKDISSCKDLSGRSPKKSDKYEDNRDFEYLIEIKAGANINTVLNELFNRTPLQSTYSVNNTVLIDNRPKVCGMLELIDDFIEQRKSCITNKSQYRIGKIKERLNRLKGLINVIGDGTIDTKKKQDNLDKAIAIIRNSLTADEAKKKLMSTFKLNDEQAEAILEMTLRKLTRSDGKKLKEETENLEKEQKELEKILSDEKTFQKFLIDDLTETKKIISDPRRTIIEKLTVEELKSESKKTEKMTKELSKDIPVKITLNKDNSISKYIDEVEDMSFIKEIIDTTSQNKLYGINKKGETLLIEVSGISLDFNDSSYNIICLAKEESTKDEKGLLLATNFGNITVLTGGFKEGTKAVKLLPGEEVIFGRWLDNTDGTMIFGTEEGKVLQATIDVKGFRAGAGTVKGMNIEDGKIIFAGYSTNSSDVLVLRNDKQYKATKISDIPTYNRGGKGVKVLALKKNDTPASSGEILQKDNLANITITERGKGWV